MSRHSAINRFGRSSNPAFSRGFEGHTESLPLSERMTLDGAVNKTGILLALCFAGAAIGWNVPGLLLFLPAIVGFVLAIGYDIQKQGKGRLYRTFICVSARNFAWRHYANVRKHV